MSLEVLMNEAISLARLAKGNTAPNPMVGAIVFQDGKILGKGFHEKAGMPHAEVGAINEALTKTGDLSGATLVVTLEPCGHFGKTPPCTDLIIKNKFERVIIGAIDPNPFMFGQSVSKLKDQGIEVVIGVCGDECEKLIRGFKSVFQKGRPFITLKAATTLDGKIATPSGESKWITSDEARLLSHRERSEHDAVLVGIGTVLADDPQLNVRIPEEKSRSVTKVILDSKLETPPTAKLLNSDLGEVLIYTESSYSPEKKAELEKAGATVIPAESTEIPGQLNLNFVLKDLAARGIQDLLVEGGSKILGAFAREKLFDRLLYFMAPKIMGGSGRDAFEGLQTGPLSEVLQLEKITARAIGQDLLIEGIL